MSSRSVCLGFYTMPAEKLRARYIRDHFGVFSFNFRGGSWGARSSVHNGENPLKPKTFRRAWAIMVRFVGFAPWGSAF